MNRLPTPVEVRTFLAANAVQRSDDRWDVPSLGGAHRTLFEPAALKLAEICLVTGTPLTDVISTDWALAIVRRLAVLEEKVAGM